MTVSCTSYIHISVFVSLLSYYAIACCPAAYSYYVNDDACTSGVRSATESYLYPLGVCIDGYEEYSACTGDDSWAASGSRGFDKLLLAPFYIAHVLSVWIVSLFALMKLIVVFVLCSFELHLGGFLRGL